MTDVSKVTLRLKPFPITISRNVTGAYYNEQFSLDFANNMTSLSYNVTAIAQNDTYGFGPGYWVNGLTNMNFWYQVGVSWNWIRGQGFRFLYEVWNATSKKSIFPHSGGAGELTFTKQIRSGDSVLLSLSFTGNEVNMSARDWKSNATVTMAFDSYGAHP